MKTKSSHYLISIIATITLAIVLTGCSAFGTNPKPPSALERHLFDIQTNVSPQVVTHTNVVTETNVIVQTVTNTVGLPVYQTNVVVQPVLQVVTVTNQVESYTLTPKAETRAGAQATGAIINGFAPGAGSLASMALLAILGAWGHLRSAKNANSASTLAQEIESIREFIKTLPQGTKYDVAITGWLSQHQVETGAAQQILKVIENDVSSVEAQLAAREINDTISALQPTPAAQPPRV